jgi:hypothetical protein
MHMVRSKADVRRTSILNRRSVKKGIMTITVPIMTNLIDTILSKGGGGVMQEESRHFPKIWRESVDPLNFKPSGIEKYDGSINSAEWLEVYQLTIETAGGDSYVMANYLPVCLSSSARTWLLRLLVGSVHSWSHLCWLFTSNFHAMCACPGVDWDLASVV